MRCFLLCLTGLCAVAAPPAVAGEDAPAADEQGVAFFESRIRPILVKHCYGCHSADAGDAQGGLRLDTRAGLRTGGERGPAIVPRDPQASLLLAAISHSDPDLQMPPDKPRLPKAVLADFEAWIKMGAPDPRDEIPAQRVAPAVDLETSRQFWSYRPPRRSAPPAVKNSDWVRRDLDRFVLARLESAGLPPSPDADPATLLRRLYFDLIGLPPAPDDIRRFTDRIDSDGIERALEAEVDALLESAHYGERWGRHWLDVARFAESSGKEANISFPYAWRYRDYVIDAFNADLPYDRFLAEQLAGDLLPYDGDAERARLLIATGFLALGPKNLDEANGFQFLADLIDEQIDTTTRAVMGSSVACARCHDHKFDPYSMEDYYALAGVFASTQTFFGTAVSPANRVGGDPLPLPRIESLQVFHESIPAKRVEQLKAEMAALRKEEEDGRAAMWKAIAAGEDASDIFTLRDALRIFWKTGAIEGQLEKVDESGEALPLAMGVLERDQMIDVPLLERGEISRPGERVPRGFPRVIELHDPPQIPDGQSGRLELARWLTHPDHPLTARVLVNRIWHHLFGAGIVRTVDNFGTTGEPPSHPELLDLLAVEFVESGWSIKQMVREIVLSRAYRQASQYREAAFYQDPENRLLWRAAKRRLEAEAIRDAMLAVSGELDREPPAGSLVGRVIGDRPISLIGLDKRLPRDLDGSTHRSVYLPVIRDRLPDVLDLFDFAEPSLVTGARDTTNVPTQAHYLLNSPFVRSRAEALAVRLTREADTAAGRVERAFRLCFGRVPEEAERERALAFLTSAAAESDAEAANADARESLVSFCQALLCTAEFRNLD